MLEAFIAGYLWLGVGTYVGARRADLSPTSARRAARTLMAFTRELISVVLSHAYLISRSTGKGQGLADQGVVRSAVLSFGACEFLDLSVFCSLERDCVMALHHVLYFGVLAYINRMHIHDVEMPAALLLAQEASSIPLNIALVLRELQIFDHTSRKLFARVFAPLFIMYRIGLGTCVTALWCVLHREYALLAMLAPSYVLQAIWGYKIVCRSRSQAT